MIVALAWLCACGAQRAPKVPGESDITVSDVTITSRDGSPLTPDTTPLFDRLGMRQASLVLPVRYYSELREAEDRRRIEAFWQNYGFFDVEVDPPRVTHDREAGSVAIAWTLKENERYSLSQVELLYEPASHHEELLAMIPFSPGDREIDLEKYRYLRRDMADRLRRDGYGHARVFSRAYVDRARRVVHWFYFVDAGPLTKVGTVVVDGAVHTSPEDVMERAGIQVGEPYTWDTRLDGEFHLLDTGAYASTFIRADVDTTFEVPGDAPDTGGPIRDEQIDDQGNLVARELPEAIDVKIHVVEAPSQQLRVRASAEADPTRFDTALSSRLWLRNLFAPWHHLVLEGRIGYGWLFDADTGDPDGLYGEALARYLKPMWLARLLDFRTTLRFKDELYNGFHLREVTAGPGWRVALRPGRAVTFQPSGLFFDLDTLFRWGEQIDLGPFDPAERERLSLADDDVYLGGEIQASVIWDERDNPLEAMSGHLLALRTSLSPGLAERWNRYATVQPDARGFVRLSESLALGLRGTASWVLLHGDEGVPLGPRLFGGGAWGMRGFGRNRLSPLAQSCARDAAGNVLFCSGTAVGGLSLAEATVEARWLPLNKPYGAVVFSDVGGAGAEANPFETGISLAAGLGLRLRLWYLPAAFDFAYRVLRDSEVQEPVDEPFLVFFRLGEAF
jgi:outer membrane translocation and assembly module TamA